jgi:hypothetical protein
MRDPGSSTPETRSEAAQSTLTVFRKSAGPGRRRSDCPSGLPALNDSRCVRRLVAPVARGSGAISSRVRRRDRVVWPPPHWRDLKRRSLPRIDPAGRCSPTWPLERIRRAPAVGYLQRDVFIEWSALDWIPSMIARWAHYQFPSRCRTIAGLSAFLILSQSDDRPDR